MTRDQMIDALHARSPLFVSRETFAATLKGWKLEPVEVDGEPAFITATRNCEFHFQCLNEKIPITRAMIRSFLRPIIAAFGYAQTKTPVDDLRQQRFNRLIGFRATAADSEFVTFSIHQVK